MSKYWFVIYAIDLFSSSYLISTVVKLSSPIEDIVSRMFGFEFFGFQRCERRAKYQQSELTNYWAGARVKRRKRMIIYVHIVLFLKLTLTGKRRLVPIVNTTMKNMRDIDGNLLFIGFYENEQKKDNIFLPKTTFSNFDPHDNFSISICVLYLLIKYRKENTTLSANIFSFALSFCQLNVYLRP